jgi:hypothetical protein
MPWSARLADPIHLADGRMLRTLSDVRAMLLMLPENEQTWPKANTITYLIIRAARAKSTAQAAVIGGRIEEMLRFPPFLSVRVTDDEVMKRPAEPSVRRREARRRRLHQARSSSDNRH